MGAPPPLLGDGASIDGGVASTGWTSLLAADPQEAPAPGPSVPPPPQRATPQLQGEPLGLPMAALGTVVSNAAHALQSTAADVFGALTTAEAGSTDSSNSGTESPSGDAAPQPIPPWAPPGGGFFSMLFSSSGGHVGGADGFVPLLLLCILASGLILLRPGGKLLRVFCEAPKPSSALLLPLERPG
jgi:hypothetical protein